MDELDSEIQATMFRWEPGELSTHTIERILTDSLADLWEDCINRHPTCSRNIFREKVMAHLLAATGERMIVR